MAYPGDTINMEQPNSLTRRGRVGKEVAQTLTCSCNQAVVEPCVLRPERTEYGKQIRKQYELGKISESRHNMTQLKPRPDGICNTLTSVQKDNLVLEPNELNCLGMLDIKGNDQIRRVYDDDDGISPTLSTMQGGNREPKVYTQYRIRKLTPKECWRLQGATDEDFEKAASVNSNSQLYKQAGNGLSVNVVTQILKQLQAKGYI